MSYAQCHDHFLDLFQLLPATFGVLEMLSADREVSKEVGNTDQRASCHGRGRRLHHLTCTIEGVSPPNTTLLRTGGDMEGAGRGYGGESFSPEAIGEQASQVFKGGEFGRGVWQRHPCCILSAHPCAIVTHFNHI